MQVSPTTTSAASRGPTWRSWWPGSPRCFRLGRSRDFLGAPKFPVQGPLNGPLKGPLSKGPILEDHTIYSGRNVAACQDERSLELQLC